MGKLLVLGIIATAAAWVVCRRKRGEVANVEERCAAIDWFATRARVAA